MQTFQTFCFAKAPREREGHEGKQGKVCSLYIERNTDKEGDSMRMREG